MIADILGPLFYNLKLLTNFETFVYLKSLYKVSKTDNYTLKNPSTNKQKDIQSIYKQSHPYLTQNPSVPK